MIKSSRTARWAVPIGVVAVIGAAAGAGPVVAAAQGKPSLPPKTAGELLAAVDQVAQSGHAPPLSGTVVENASLGLPSLPGTDKMASASPMSLLSGSNTVRVWYADEQHARLALLGAGSEVDLIHNGQDVWQWDSSKNTVTHSRTKAAEPKVMKKTPLTPQQAATQILAAVGKTTTLRVDPTGRVAGRPVYELVLSPKDDRSLIGQVRLALDGKTFVPLRVQVYPRNSGSPAAQIGFTSVTFSKPAAANFQFKAPSGAKLIERRTPQPQRVPGTKGPKDLKNLKKAHDGSKLIGEGWTAVRQLSLPANLQKNDRSGMYNALMKASTPVDGGRVLRTKLVSAFLTDDGRLFVGAVTPDVLTAAAGHK